jgi:uncharacterized protein
MHTRRNALGALASLSTGLGALGLTAWPSLGTAKPKTKTTAPVRLVSAWEHAGKFSIGVLATSALGGNKPTKPELNTIASLPVPTRAHGVQALADGTVLAVAKRPGDWLLRWAVGSSFAAQWHWAEPGRAFNGHAIVSPDGQRIYTTETDLDTGMGLVGVRDARTLTKLTEWPTLGMDPHELTWDTSLPQRLTLIVANGGISTQPETGRAKLQLDKMDSSIVRLDATSGELLGQWRLKDKRLSLRHLAWQAAISVRSAPLLGIALQAEHDTAEQRQNASVLALFDGTTLRMAASSDNVNEPTHPATQGYGGDIAALADGWAVSCPRGHGIALFETAGQWREWAPLHYACALASTGQGFWAAGRSDALQIDTLVKPFSTAQSGLQLDNHWAPMPG